MSDSKEKRSQRFSPKKAFEHAAYAKTHRNQKRMLTKNGRLIGYLTAFEAWEQHDDIRRKARALDDE